MTLTEVGDQPVTSRRRSKLWSGFRLVVGLALGALALEVLNGQRNELLGASERFGQLRVIWLLVAIVAEVISFVSFGALQRRLLHAGGVLVKLRVTTAIAFAAGAIADSMPAGPAFASIFAFHRYRRRGANQALAGWVLLATLVCSALALGILATVGVILAAQEGASYDLIWVTLGVLAISIVADAVVWQRRWLARVSIVMLRCSRRIFSRPRREGVEVVTELLERLAAVELSWRDLLYSIVAGLGNWGFDCACLLFSFLAVGAPIPWRGLLLAYGAAQLAANLPITPGGLGVVEGSLTIALVAFGGAELSTVTAVLLYRIISFWGFLPVGWTVFGAYEVIDRRHERMQEARARWLTYASHLNRPFRPQVNSWEDRLAKPQASTVPEPSHAEEMEGK